MFSGVSFVPGIAPFQTSRRIAQQQRNVAVSLTSVVQFLLSDAADAQSNDTAILDIVRKRAPANLRRIMLFRRARSACENLGRHSVFYW